MNTLRWQDIDFHNNTLGVRPRPEYNFEPKFYEVRSVRVPKTLIQALKARQKSSKGPLVFPTAPHPLRPDYGGNAPDEHHLELGKEIAYRAGLNCGFCVVESGEPAEIESTAGKKKRLEKSRKCSDGPYCGQWYLHKWRHTFATMQLRSDFDVKTMQELLGHKNLLATRRGGDGGQAGTTRVKLDTPQTVLLNLFVQRRRDEYPIEGIGIRAKELS